MYSEIESFGKWLRRKSQHTTTHLHYTSDLRLFFIWAGKSPAEITISDVDQYIAYAQEHGHAIATINRRVRRSVYFIGSCKIMSLFHQTT